MSHPFDILDLGNGSRFIFTPCPGTKGFPVEASMQTLKDAGAEAVVTMMTAHELSEHEAESIAVFCETNGLPWFHLPVEDSCAPEAPFEMAFALKRQALLDLVKAGTTIAIHCHGGSGRTGMMAAILMLSAGFEPEVVKAKIQQIRPKSLKSVVQVEYLKLNHGYHVAADASK